MKKYKPTTPSSRSRTVTDKSHLSQKGPTKKLIRILKKTTGRDHGTISVRHRGGGNFRKYRLIDFKRFGKLNIEATVTTLEYDPYRSANIALLTYKDGDRLYIIAPHELKVGDSVICSETAKIKIGNALPLKSIPVGIGIHNLELNPGQGGIIVRSAGQEAKVLAKDAGMVQVKLPSGEVRLVSELCYATIGQVSNVEHSQRVLGKAGAVRWIRRRPQVRGTAMAAGDHPHGGGEGRTGTGRVPRTVYGKSAFGVRTRRPHKMSDKFIVKTKRQK